MFLHDLEIKQFRCFKHQRFYFSKQFTLIIGNNGSGKTSLVEAIHCLCYMKSFRCSNVSDLVEHESDSFFVKGSFNSLIDKETQHTLQVGYADKKKSVKLDHKAVTTYKQIFELFQVITLLEEDIHLIKGYPSERRTFIDEATLFLDSSYLDTYRSFKKVVQNRNALLHSFTIDALELDIWTEKLWTMSLQIQKQRIHILNLVQHTVNDLLIKHFDAMYTVELHYEPHYIVPDDNYTLFKQKNYVLFGQERVLKRSLFGAHLDDFSIHIKGQKARFFASRGQQKLVSLLCKLSLVILAEKQEFLPILIIDDFIADFDKIRLKNLMDFFVSCKNQIIITTPFYDSELQQIIGFVDPEIISMNT